MSWRAPVIQSAELLIGVTAPPFPRTPLSLWLCEPIDRVYAAIALDPDLIHPRRAREEPQRRHCVGAQSFTGRWSCSSSTRQRRDGTDMCVTGRDTHTHTGRRRALL